MFESCRAHFAVAGENLAFGSDFRRHHPLTWLRA